MTVDHPVSMKDRLSANYTWTARQRQVLDLLRHGRSNAEIAQELGISIQGVKFHVTEILGKLHAESREEAADYWRRDHGLAPRFARTFRGAVSASAFKYVGAAISVGVVGVGALILAAAMRDGGDDNPGRPAGTTPSVAVSGTPAQIQTWVWQRAGQNDYPWITVTDSRAYVATGPRYQGGANFFIGPGRVTALDVASGAEVWTFDTPSQPFPVQAVGELAVFGTSDGTVFALNASSGTETWRHEFPGVPFQVVAFEGGIAVADGDPETWGPNGIADKTRLAGRVRVLSVRTGDVVWEDYVGNFETFITAAAGGIVVASSGYDGADEVAFFEANGKQRWRVPTGQVESPPVVAPDSVAVAGSAMRLYSLADGRQRWSVTPKDGGTFSGASIQGDIVIAASNTHSVEAFRLADGTRHGFSTFPDCGLQPIKDSDLFLSCGSIVRIVAAGGTVTPSIVLTPQGQVYSAAFAHGRIFYAFNTGHFGPTVAQHTPP